MHFGAVGAVQCGFVFQVWSCVRKDFLDVKIRIRPLEVVAAIRNNICSYLTGTKDYPRESC